jgi:hypothetical protein
MEHDFARDLIILDSLNQVTRSEIFAIERTEHEKSVRYTFTVVDSDRIGECAITEPKNAGKQHPKPPHNESAVCVPGVARAHALLSSSSRLS